MSVTTEAPAVEEPTSWGSAAPAAPKFMFWFTLPDGSRFCHFDMTVAEAAAVEKRLGCSWWSLRPVAVVEHGQVALETFLARTVGAEAAAKQVGAMTMRDLEAAIVYEEGRDDDLPDGFTDGIPK